MRAKLKANFTLGVEPIAILGHTRPVSHPPEHLVGVRGIPMGIYQGAMGMLEQPLPPGHFLASHNATGSSWNQRQPQETLAQDDLELQDSITRRQPVIVQLQLRVLILRIRHLTLVLAGQARIQEPLKLLNDQGKLRITLLMSSQASPDFSRTVFRRKAGQRHDFGTFTLSLFLPQLQTLATKFLPH